jgi:cysteine-rich repeat protein
MSWSLQVRVLGACGLWLLAITGCGGNPVVSSVDDPTPGGGTAGTGATSAGGSGGTPILQMGGENSMGEGGSGDEPVDYVCGNQVLEPGEFCDDGNTNDDDGCSADCSAVDPDYDCSVVGQPCDLVVICGNGILEGDELCDDLNTVGGDGCAADCSAEEPGFVCIRPGTPCVEVPECGNGVRERGEECDSPGDGCDDQCQLEPNYACPNPGMACILLVCGNGTRTPNEDCDDNNMASGDGCSSACVVEPGFRCNTDGCLPICGDGLVKMGEECDDNNRNSSDGCSAACTEEPFFNCTGEPSTCVTTIACGNGAIEPGEICDPPGQNGCSAGCKSFNPDTSDPAVCGNNLIEEGETCDPPNGNMGCSAACAVQNGWTCPQAGVCFRNPFCGDGIVQSGEECETPALAGCDNSCQEEAGWTCVGFGPSICVNPQCGNGMVEPGEQCDDGTATATADGCNNTCTVGAGWACPTPGMPCIPRCGDGTKLPSEQCDDGDLMSGDGCNSGCKIEPGFKCPTPNMSCVAAVCGDGVVDSGEGCDTGGRCIGGSNPFTLCDANSDCTGGGVCRPVAGDAGQCSATCQPEPTVTLGTNPTVAVDCGDGLITGSEECDDGDDDAGDGCSATCTEEDGWICDEDVDLPGTLQMTVTYRDFKAGNATSGDGHTDFQYQHLDHFAGITGAPCTNANQATCGRLNTLGKPALIVNNQTETGILNADTFALWYANNNSGNVQNHLGNVIAMKSPAVKTLTLTQTPAGSETYVFDSMGNNFYPLLADNTEGYGPIGTEVALCNNGAGVTNVTGQPACDGCDATCRARNYNFTTELRYYFQYKGGETLSFVGDDDVWVYINGRLAVDMGGLHSAESGQVVLGDENSGCSKHSGGGNPPDPTGGCYSAAEQTDTTDNRFGNYNAAGTLVSPFVKGGVYEIVLFHAERHTGASNFKLTLAGFLAPRSFCNPDCGDGEVVGDEVCDDEGAPGGCNDFCTAFDYCGDGVPQAPEECDNGTNLTQYDDGTAPANACAPGCQDPAFCGDGVLQAGQGPNGGEECDLGAANNNNAYGPTQCRTNCKLGGYCGDMVVNGNETCDAGTMNGKTYGPNSCGYNCQPGPRCGDDIRNGSEQCDDGADNGTAQSLCDTDCTIKPYCGDGVKQANEQCDYGQFASSNYGGCTNMCMNGPSCGDGVFDPPYEECDDGTANNTGGYDGCTNKCDNGPHCGDGVVEANVEMCDNGFNDDDYMYEDDSCGDGCIPPPYCGDAIVQSAHELCDLGTGVNNDDTYEGCTTTCEFGPFCGDGTVDPEETCDDGLGNVSYDPMQGGCGYDCEDAPYCGDGERNGPEQCDLGAGMNTGDYGSCNPDCTFAPRCGDRTRQGTEECDDGPSGSLNCTPLCKRRIVVQ